MEYFLLFVVLYNDEAIMIAQKSREMPLTNKMMNRNSTDRNYVIEFRKNKLAITLKVQRYILTCKI